jgi:hypothetical protein
MLSHSPDAQMTPEVHTDSKNERPTLEKRKGCEMHGMELRLIEFKAKQEALLLEAERNRLIGLAHGPRQAWTLSSLLPGRSKLKIVKA